MLSVSKALQKILLCSVASGFSLFASALESIPPRRGYPFFMIHEEIERAQLYADGRLFIWSSVTHKYLYISGLYSLFMKEIEDLRDKLKNCTNPTERTKTLMHVGFEVYKSNNYLRKYALSGKSIVYPLPMPSETLRRLARNKINDVIVLKDISQILMDGDADIETKCIATSIIGEIGDRDPAKFAYRMIDQSPLARGHYESALIDTIRACNDIDLVDRLLFAMFKISGGGLGTFKTYIRPNHKYESPRYFLHGNESLLGYIFWRSTLSLSEASRYYKRGLREKDLMRKAQLFKTAVEKNFQEPGYYAALAYSLVDLSMPSDSIKTMQACRLFFPFDPDVNLDFGRILQKTGRLEESLKFFDDSILLFSRHAKAYLHKAQSFQALGRIDQAKKTIEEGLAIYEYLGDSIKLGTFTDKDAQELRSLYEQLPKGRKE